MLNFRNTIFRGKNAKEYIKYYSTYIKIKIMQNYIIRDNYVQGKSIKKNKGMKNTKFRTEVGKGRGSGMEKAY